MNTTFSLQIRKELEDEAVSSNYFCSFKFSLDANRSYALDVYRRSGIYEDENIEFFVTTYRASEGSLQKKDHYITD